MDTAFEVVIRVRRYLCQACQRTVSLLPDFVLPYLRSSLLVIAVFLIAMGPVPDPPFPAVGGSRTWPRTR
jgi:hypothetical protein